MITNELKAGLKESTSTTNGESKATPESKFTEEPQNNSNSSESGQQYETIDNSPFAAVKYGNKWKVVIGDMIASPKDFMSANAVKNYVRNKHWELLWTMAVWIINNQEKFMIEKKK